MRLLGNVRFQIALILLLAIAPLAGLSIYMAIDEGHKDAANAQADARGTVHLVARDLNNVIQSTSDLVAGLGRNPAIRNGGESCNAELAALEPSFPRFSNVFMLDRDSTVLCAASNPLHVRTLRDRPENRAVIERVRGTRQTVVGDFARTYPGKRIIPVAGPVIDETGQVSSILFASIDLDKVDEQVNSVQLPPQAVLLIMDSRGDEIARNPRSRDWPAGTPAPALERTLAGSGDFDREIKGYDGITRFYSVARVRTGENLLVVMKIRANEIYRPARRRLALHLAGLAVVGLLVMGLTWFGSDSYFRRPLSRLVDTANRLASGNLRARSGLRYSGDIGSLAQSFDQMADTLESNQMSEREAASRDAARLNRLRKLSDLSMMLAGDPATVFERIVSMIGELFEVRGVCLSEIAGPDLIFRAILVQGKVLTNPGGCPLEMTPCATVAESRNIRIYERVMDLFPSASFLPDHNAYMWCGIPSLNNAGQVVAVTSLVDDKPREFTEEDRQILWVIGQRIGAELERIRSMAEHVRMQEALRENERRLQEAQHMARVGSFTGGGALGAMEWSDEMYRIFEVDPSRVVPGMDAVMSRAHPDDYDLIDRTSKLLTGDMTCEVEHRLLMPDGRVKHVLVRIIASPSDGAPQTRGTVQDITERKVAEEEKIKLQAQLNQSQKMESVGRLAGGIAHDFNNLLTVINGYSGMLMRQMDSPARRQAEQIRRAGESAASLTRQLLAFSRMEATNPQCVHLNEIVAEARDMFDRLVGDDIDIRTNLGASPDEVLADSTQIQQCVMNLVVNARDAMPRGGLLLIETSSVHVEQQHLPPGTDAEPGPFVVLKVRDSGIGMDEETSQRVFEPFFTTKEKGRGTGLGLSTVYGMVSQWRGFVKVTSEPGKGAEFSICLPANRILQPLRDEGVLSTAAASPSVGSILVVEDQDIVREFVIESLRTHGHTVLDARSGAEALDLLGKKDSDIRVLISDVMMPGMKGTELAVRARAVCPSLEVLLMTGYADDSVRDDHGADGRTEMIMKPFTPEDLEARVQNLLNFEHTPLG
jgi:signal transduction histidine kinase/HAMP domain-containing protein/ActR/RegA family two-component response regulator